MERENGHKINYVKIHTPKEVLCTYCDILNIKLPIKDVRDEINSLMGILAYRTFKVVFVQFRVAITS